MTPMPIDNALPGGLVSQAAGVHGFAPVTAGTASAAAVPIPTHALRLGDTIGVHTIHLAGKLFIHARLALLLVIDMI
jgi:hypothetical protein